MLARPGAGVVIVSPDQQGCDDGHERSRGERCQQKPWQSAKRVHVVETM